MGERGHALEEEAIAAFEEETGKKVKHDVGVWVSDENENIAISPDGEIGKSEAVEVKCLSSANHVQALFEKEIPDEFYEQTLQYFVVNEKLKKLYVIFYDPRIVAKPMFFLTLERKNIVLLIKLQFDFEIKSLTEINEFINSLTF